MTDHAAIRRRHVRLYNIARGWAATWRQRYIWHPTEGTRAKLAEWRRKVAFEKRVIARHTVAPLHERAYDIAASQVGVVESGGNNRGVPFERYQKPNGASGPEAWCGDFMAWCYRKAGSKSVVRAWAAVRLLLPLTGLKRTSKPVRGDLVRFTFDHVGMFVEDLGAYIETIEGNTGDSGEVSDSPNGDGVKRKRRHKSLVRDYIHVTA